MVLGVAARILFPLFLMLSLLEPAAATGPSGGLPLLISAELTSAPRSFSRTYFGLNGNNVTRGGPAWSHSQFKSALKSLRPGTLRYPGGTVGNYWDWRRGWLQPGGPWPITPLKKFDNSVGTFATAVKASGATPVFVLNLLTFKGAIASRSKNEEMLHDQLEFLKAAKAAGLAVRIVELGNEFYLQGAVPGNDDYSKRFPTASDYASQANPWITAIHRVFPEARVAAVGADNNGLAAVSDRRKTWNSSVLSALRGQDALTLHVYVVVSDAKTPVKSVLALPYQRFQQLRSNELKLLRSKGLKAWVTEYGLTDRTPALSFAGTWTHGLFSAALAVLLVRDAIVNYLSLFNVVGDGIIDARVASIFADSNGFGSSGPSTTPFAFTAQGRTLELLARAAQGRTSAQPLSFSPQPTLVGTIPAVIGSVFGGGDRRSGAVLNLSDAPVLLDAGAVFTGTFGYEQLTSASPMSRITGPSSVTVSRDTTAEPLLLPAYSITRLYA